MDKWLDNPWFLKALALLLAFLLFLSVSSTDPGKPGDVNVPSDENSETIADVPVKSYYDTENLVVSGVPKTVDITIEGPKNIVQQARALRDFEVFVDLTKEGMGNHQVQLQIKDISEKLEVTIDPSYITVSIQERVTKEYKVNADYNTSMIQDGYIAGTASVEPSNVKITGAKNIIDTISYVKANVTLNDNLSENLTREAGVLVLDKDMNKLNVTVEPETVEVTIPVKPSSKDVPIDIITKGEPPEGVTIESITSNVKEATIMANPDVLKGVSKVRVEVDVSNVTEDTEVTLPVIISNGVVSVSPETAKLSIKVEKQEEKKVTNIPITIEGQSEDYEVEFLNPENGRSSVTVTGQAESVESLDESDFKFLIDVSGLEEGEHTVDIQSSAPKDVEWKPSIEQANISITKKEEETQAE
ncbi:CdaR family protein [Mesobacillus foraminis]|uniref:CdaR family protein n=1 Tax=Mesobacillus foraminis TaxID=279826 RepID=UPI0039A2E791